MAQYQKYMFDNFVISCNDEECVAEPLDIEEETEETLAEEEIKQEAEEVESQEEKGTEVLAKKEESEKQKDPSYSQSELDAAVKSAEEQGYEKGFNSATTELQKAEAAALEEINTRLVALLSGEIENKREAEASALKFAVELVRKLLPNLEAEVAKQEVEAFLSDNFSKFRGEKNLSFSFHPDMAAEIAPQLSKLAEKNDFEGKISVHKDINLNLSDCRVEWRNGGVERNTENVLEKVENILNQ